MSRQCRLAEPPALPAHDPWVRWRGIRAISGQYVEHTQHAQHTVEAVLAGGVAAKPIRHGELARIRHDVKRGHRRAEPLGRGGSIGLATLAALQLDAEVAERLRWVGLRQ